MSVGLEDVLDFQKFLLDTQGWPVNGARHRRIVRDQKDIADFLKILADFGKVGIDCGDVKAARYEVVEVYPEHLVIWGSDTSSDYGLESALALVPDHLKIVAASDPRSSYVKLAHNPFARLPEKAFPNEVFSPILFYPANSLVPVGTPNRFVTASEKSDFYMAIDKRMDKFFEYLGKRYPLVELLKRSTIMDDEFVYAFTFLTASRPHENKRELVMHEWLYENIPFPVRVDSRILGQTKAGSKVSYLVSFQLPE